MPLEKELKTYEQNKPSLLAKSAGKFVLIKGDQIIETFSSYADALSAGYKQFSDQEFLVKEIKEIETINYFSRSLNLV